MSLFKSSGLEIIFHISFPSKSFIDETSRLDTLIVFLKHLIRLSSPFQNMLHNCLGSHPHFKINYAMLICLGSHPHFKINYAMLICLGSHPDFKMYYAMLAAPLFVAIIPWLVVVVLNLKIYRIIRKTAR